MFKNLNRSHTENSILISELRNNPGLLSFLLDSAESGFALLDADGCYIDVNSYFAETLGYKAEELSGMHFSEITCPLSDRINRDRFKELSNGRKESAVMDVIFFTKTGEDQYLRASLYAFKSVNSDSVLIAAAYTRMQLYLNDFPETVDPALPLNDRCFPSVFITDLDGGVIFGSRNAAARLGYNVKEMCSLNLSDILTAEDSGRILAMVYNNLSVRSLECELNISGKSGVMHPVPISLFFDYTDRFKSGNLLIFKFDDGKSESKKGSACRRNAFESLLLSEVRELKDSMLSVSASGTGVPDPLYLRLADYNLTLREREVFELLRRRLNTKEIAYEMEIAEITVRKHLSGIYRKFGVCCREDLMLLMLGRELIQ